MNGSETSEEVKATAEQSESVEETQEPEVLEAEEKDEAEVLEMKEEKEPEEDFKAKFYYLAAEMENQKKRFERDRENLVKYGNEKVLSSLIEVVDNLDRTLDALNGEEDEKVKNILTGVDMVRTQFLDVLKKSGLERIDSVGEIFDPNKHEAMAQQPAEGKKDQEIIQEYQKGYVLNGRLMRAAKVIIANNS